MASDGDIGASKLLFISSNKISSTLIHVVDISIANPGKDLSLFLS